MTLERRIKIAARREYHDDHLSHEEREQLVAAFRAEHPEVVLPADLDEAFVEIIF